MAQQAADQAGSPVDDLGKLLEGEAGGRPDRATQSRLRRARLPGMQTLEQCRWDWPTRMHRLQGPPQVRLELIKDKSNVI